MGASVGSTGTGLQHVPAWTQRASTACTGVAAALGGVALLGWVLDVPALRSLVPGTPSMTHDTATGVAIAALATWPGMGTWVRRAGAIAMLAVGVAGIADATLHANAHAAPLTGSALCLLGLALLVAPWRTTRGQRPAEWLALGAAALAVVTLTAYVLAFVGAESVPAIIGMSVPAALATMALATALLLAPPHGRVVRLVLEPGSAAWATRVVLPAVVAISVVLEVVETLLEQRGAVVLVWGSAAHVVADVVLLTALMLFAASRFTRLEAERRRADAARVAAEASARQARRVEAIATVALSQPRPDALLPALAEQARVALGARVAVIALTDGTTTIAPPGASEPDPAARASAPLAVGPSPLGTLTIGAAPGHAFDAGDLATLALIAGPLALAVERARLLHETERLAIANSESLQRHRFLAESLPALVWMLNADGEVEYVNARLVEYTGFTADELHGDQWTAIIAPDDRGAALARRDVMLSGGDVGLYELRLRRRDGAYRWHVGRTLSIRGLDGRVARLLGTFVDIHDQKLAGDDRKLVLERERAARQAAESASRAKDDFLGTLSHEMRTPLAPILAWTDLLRQDALSPDEAREALAAIDRAARMQARLVEDLLDVSAIVAGKLRLEPKPVVLGPVVRAAVESVLPAAQSRGVEVEEHIDDDETPVIGDAARLQQVAWNLLSNAIKFTPRGGHVTVDLARRGTRWALRVTDTGQGIPPEFLPHVFERFRQADATPGRQHGGLGLGLAIVRHLVQLQGGTVRAESAGEGRGATFVVELPMHFAASPSAAAPAQPNARSLTGMRVLLVDDDESTLEALRLVLEVHGAEVEVGRSAAEALAVLDRWVPDVIVSDIGMPEEDGMMLVRQIRARSPERGGRVPAMALTAYARPEDRDAAIAAGFDRHLTKPIDPALLVAAIVDLRRPHAA